MDLPRFERFEVLRPIGAGGMGVVWEAIDRRTGARVALKTLQSVGAERLWRLKREFRALADVAHDNLIALGELVEDGGAWCFTMELVDGVDVLDWIRGPFRRDPSIGETAPPAAPTVEATPTGHGDIVDAGPVPTVDGPPPRWDEGRLRAALRQLAAALTALHGAGLVHRDVKPSNVLVTPAGRVVLLDFGLVADQGEAETAAIVGTVAYMAPEQAQALPVGPAADWYAFGVLLYQALTGRTPHVGETAWVLGAKASKRPLPPREIAPSVPEDLDALVGALLEIDPARRAGAAEVMAALGAAPAAPTRRRFVGRVAELAAIERAFAASRQGAAVVLVEGASGIGKTTLVRRAVDALRAREPRLVHLAGRCYPRETVPFKGLDGVVDSAAAHLRRLPQADALRLVPQRLVLREAFPVLRGLVAAGAAPAAADERRAQLFDAVRGLCGSLAAAHPTVITIDDLQWADGDTLALLAAVLAAPAPPLLVLATVREATAAIAARLPAAQPLPLAALAADDAAALALALCDGDAGAAAQVTREAAGHPLFIDTLARQRGAGTGARLDDALWSTCAQLEPTARGLLELAVLAGAPVSAALLERAAAVGSDEALRALAALRAGRLVRSAVDRADRLEPYHDRLREAVLARLAPARRAAGHRALAEALVAEPAPDADLLALHWREAGEPARAAEHAVAAAAHAAGVLAFEHAAHMYRVAIELGAPVGAGASSLWARLGDARAAAGDARAAGDAYLRAAESGDADDAFELRRRAADVLIRGGAFDAGTDLLGGLMRGLGLPSPRRSGRRLLASVLLGRARLRLRGLEPRPAPAAGVRAKTLHRIDLCWSAALDLGLVDHMVGADYQTRHVRLALDAGEPTRVARALTIQVAFRASAGPPHARRALATLDELERRAAAAGDEAARANARWVRVMIRYLALDFAGAADLAIEILPELRAHPAGVPWELALMRYYLGQALGQLGRLAELRTRIEPALREAIIKNDLNARWSAVVPYHLAALAADEPARARTAVDELLAAWSQRGCHIQHQLGAQVRAHLALYEGRAAEAHAIVTDIWERARRAHLLRLGTNRILLTDLRARAALAAAAAATDPAPYLADAAAMLEALRTVDEPWPTGLRRFIAGRRAVLTGARADGARRLDDAAAVLALAGTGLAAAGARRAAFDAEPTAVREDAWHEARKRLVAEGVVDPDRFVRLWSTT